MMHKESKANVDFIAKHYGFLLIDFQENIGMVSYSKLDVRINVYLTTMSVGTCLRHPKKGFTQLFRRNVTLSELILIFQNPRYHTGKGYYKKDKK